jgi:hypothetical protein
VSLFLPPPYRQPLIDIHTHPLPGGGSFLRKNPPPSVGFEPTSAGTATSEHCLRQPCGHRANFSAIFSLFKNSIAAFSDECNQSYCIMSKSTSSIVLLASRFRSGCTRSRCCFLSAIPVNEVESTLCSPKRKHRMQNAPDTNT